MKNNKTLIVIFGPTASGKTALGIKLAQTFNTEIVNADSRQVYKELNIGTAKPTKHELIAAKHHLVGHISILDKYNVGVYYREARKIINNIFENNDVVILSGGTGLYIDAVLYGLNKLPLANDELRNELNNLLKEKGIKYLQNRLRKSDKNALELIDSQNPARIKRAIEIVETSGKTLAENWTKPNDILPYKIIKVGLNPNRKELYNKINKRVDIMLQNGLVKENISMQKHNGLNALNTVGYKEFQAYFMTEVSLEEAIDKLKQNTRNYAKRQLTWLRNSDNYTLFQEYGNGEILGFIRTELK